MPSNLLLEAVKKIVPVKAKILQIILVGDGLNHLDIGAGNEIVWLGRDKHNGLNVWVVLDVVRPHLLRLCHDARAQGVHLLRSVQADKGYTVTDFERTEVLATGRLRHRRRERPGKARRRRHRTPMARSRPQNEIGHSSTDPNYYTPSVE